MAYPHWQGVVPSTQIERSQSPIIPGVGIYGLTHDYGDIEAAVEIDFTLGHHQKFTLSENATVTIPVPPGAMELVFEVTQSDGGGWTIVWPNGTMSPGMDLDALLTPAATNPAAVDLICAYYNGVTWLLSSIMLDAKTAGA
jgi:hypothetical protein